MAKDKEKKKSKAGPSSDGFGKPSEAKGGGDGWTLADEDNLGRLLLFTPLREDSTTVKRGKKTEDTKIIVADVVVMLRQQLFQAIPDASQALAAELSLGTADERIIRAAMKAVAREALTAFVAAAAQANADLTHESPNATRDRIGQLAVVSAILRRRPDRHLAILRERAG